MALVGVAALVGGAWWVGRQSAPAAGPEASGGEARLAFVDLAEDERPSIAVMPFADMSPEQDQEYFGDGMTEEILNTLIRIKDLRVSGRTSTFAYKGQDKDLREIGSELGVRYIVEGSVRKSGDRLRITAQLIDAADGTHLWGDQYDRPMDDVFKIQTEIAEAIANELRVPLGLGEDERLVTPTADLDAYDLYLAGRSKMRERGPSLLEAAELFKAAIARDSTWAPAWAGLAKVEEIRIWYASAQPEGMTPAEFTPMALEAAERAARRALELDPRNSSALVALGSVQRNRAEWEASEATYLRALETDPDNPEAHQQYGDLLLNVGRIAEGVRALDRAAALDRAPIRFEMLGFGLFTDGRPEEGMEAYVLAASRNTTTDGKRRSLDLLGSRYLNDGQWEEAAESWKAANRLDPDAAPVGVDGKVCPAPFDAAPVLGSDEDIDAFVKAIRDSDLSGVPIAMRDSLMPSAWLRFGEPDSAVVARIERMRTVFGRAIEMRLPDYAPIRSDPRIQAYMAERGLGDAPEIRTPPDERTRPIALREATTP